MKELFCHCGKSIWIDDKDLTTISRHRWRCEGRGEVYTVISNKAVNIGYFILDPKDGFVIDHIDTNIHNNQSANLRYATKSQNTHNSKLRKDNQSGFKGVHWHRSCKYRPWVAQLIKDGKKYYSHHETAEEAAHAYDKMAIEMFGEFARVNFPISQYKQPTQSKQ